MKLHRKIKHNEKVCHPRFRFLRPRSRSQSGQRSKSCLSNNSKTTQANLMKLHRKIEHNEKVCQAQELGVAHKILKQILMKLHGKIKQ